LLESAMGRWARSTFEQENNPIKLPALQSDLAYWAFLAVEQEESSEQSTRACSGDGDDARHMASADAQVSEEEQLEEQRKWNFVADNSELQDNTLGLAYRRSKSEEDRVEGQGLLWGKTVAAEDCGDGWLKVESYFVPTQLRGVTVLQPARSVPATWDGPALTADGRALDLEGGAPIFFSCAKELSSGYEDGRRLRVLARLAAMVMAVSSKVRLAEMERIAAARVEEELVCSIDDDGLVHGPLSTTLSSSARVSRHRSAAGRIRKAGADDTVFCADESGKVTLYLHLPIGAQEKAARAIRRSLRKRRAFAVGEQDIESPILVLDAHGTIQDVDEC